MSEPNPVIEIKGLTYAYSRAEAVHDFNLTLHPGRCYGLFGRNGAGKTTTMKCLLNLLRPRRAIAGGLLGGRLSRGVARRQQIRAVIRSISEHPSSATRTRPSNPSCRTICSIASCRRRIASTSFSG